MKKKWILISLSTMIALLGIVIAMLIFKRNLTQNSKAKIETLEIAGLSDPVSDDCVEEWEEMQEQQNALETNSKDIEIPYNEIEQQKEFFIKEEEGRIVVYLIKNNEEVLYEKTDFSIDYLPIDDRQNIQNGIKIYGEEALSQFLENFE